MPMKTADLESLDAHLNGRSYIDEEEMTDGDAKVFALFLGNKPNSESYPNVSKWYEAVKEKLASSYLEKAAAEEREAVKASTKKKTSGKTSVVRLEIEIEWPWDGETSERYKKRFLENASNLDIEGLVWSAFKIVQGGEGGVMEVHILLTVLDDLVDRNVLSSNVYSMLIA